MPELRPDHQAFLARIFADRRARHGGATMTGPVPTDPPQPPGPPAPPTPPAPPPPDDQPRTFTQDQLTGIIGRETAQARQAAQAQLLQTLGFDSVESAQQAVQAAEAARQAQLTEAQRAQEQAQQAQAQAQAERAQAQALVRQFTVDSALLRAGVVSDGTDEGNQRVSTIRRMVELPTDGEVTPEVASAAVGQVRAMFPALFTGTPTPPPPPAPPSDPTARPPAPQIGDSAYERGMARARSRSGGDDAPKITPAGH